jgi:hypothetical protein
MSLGIHQNLVIAQRSPTKLRPHLKVLRESAANDCSGALALELAKFGFSSPTQFDQVHSPSRIHNKVTFGSFSDPINLDLQDTSMNRFIGINFQKKLCEFLPMDTLLQLQDLRQAGYSDPEIMEVLKIPIVPPKDLVSSFIPSCLNCGRDGHVRDKCNVILKETCFKCFGKGYSGPDCLLGWRCKICKKLGHVARLCSNNPARRQTMIWRKKLRHETREQTEVAGKIWVVKSPNKGTPSGPE